MPTTKKSCRPCQTLLAALMLSGLLSVSAGCSTPIPAKRDPALTKPILKIAPRNQHGEPFGRGMVWQDCEIALMSQWQQVDRCNDQLGALAK